MNLSIARIPSPIGTIYVAARAHELCALVFEDRWPDAEVALRRRFRDVALTDDSIGDRNRRALDAYFAGDITAIDHVPVDLGGTPFQARVWAALRHVPAGSTASYADIAARIGRPTATRAVGAANGRNPVSIVVPCHRIIGSDGKLHGYGQGVDRKQWLLDHEGARTAQPGLL